MQGRPPPRTQRKHAPLNGLLIVLLVIGEYVRLNMDRFFFVLFFSRLFFELAVGVTLIAIIRNVVGIRTLGTFAPAIVALAFLQTGPIIGGLRPDVRQIGTDNV